jgi:hypothetical protein
MNWYLRWLVTTNDPEVAFKDKAIARQVSRRIGKEFIGTVEDDEIIYTILDLEQYLGKKIHWVAGKPYEDVIKDLAYGYLPNARRSYCTTELKMRPIFHWWHEYFNAEPVMMNIGYRANEKKRADEQIAELNSDGLSEFKATFGKNKQGKNKWQTIAWRKPCYPLVDDFIYPQDIKKFWTDKNVRFAQYNNCVGCFQRSAMMLKKMSKLDPDKFDWFVRQEQLSKGQWKADVSYKKITELNFTVEMDFESEGCSSGFCGF